jgi:two-component system response regulator NreC
MRPLRILVADDHEVVREGTRVLLHSQLGWEVCGTAKNGREAVEQAQKLQPDIVVLDMSMPELNGLDAARKIKRILPTVEILMFTALESEQLIRQVFEAGVKSYVVKADASAHLLSAVRSLGEHKPYFTSKVAQTLFARFMDRSPDKPNGKDVTTDLTSREFEIVRLLAEGSSNKEIASILEISVRTAETHRATLMRKCGAGSLAGVVRYAIRNHIVEA